MTSPDMLLELAGRLEAAKGVGSHLPRLSAEVQAALKRAAYPDATVVKVGRIYRAVACQGVGRGWRRYGIFFECVSYCASLQDALLLVPNDAEEWNVEGWRKPSVVHRGAKATAWVSGAPRVYAATPALALTAAALRAKAQQLRPSIQGEG